MTNSLSKLKLFDSVAYNCYETSHTWTPSCWDSFHGFVLESIEGALPIYLPLYLAPHVLSMNFSAGALQRTGWNFVKSITALSCNTSLIMGLCCLSTQVTGRTYYLSPFFSSFIAHFFSFWNERESRRNALAMFSTKSAFEIMFKILQEYGHLKNFPENRASIVLFAASIAVNFYLAKKTGFTRDPLSQILAFLVGKQEGAALQCPVATVGPSDGQGQRPMSLDLNDNQIERSSRDDSREENNGGDKMIGIHKSQECDLALMSPCPHQGHCIMYAVRGFVKPFLVGWLVQGSFLALRRKAVDPLPVLTDPMALRFGLFLGGMSAVFKACQCTLRCTAGRDQDHHALISGFLAALALGIYPSTQIALYTFWKTAYTLYWMRFGHTKWAQYGVDFAFNIADSLLIHCSIMEPQYITRSYLNFVDKVTGSKLRLFNVVVYSILTRRISEQHKGSIVHSLDAEHVSNRYLETIGSWMLENKSTFHRFA